MTSTHQQPASRRWAGLLAAAILLTGCGPAGNEVGEPGRQGPSDSESVTRARAAFDQVAERFAADDAAGLRDLSTGPAAAFFAHADHLHRASGGSDDVFPHARADSGEATVDGSSVTFTGPVTWGDPEGPGPRVLSELRFREHGEAWELDSFTRNGFPIERWVTPEADEGAESGPVTAHVVGVFVDITCLEGADPDCPELLQGGLAVDFEVTNDSDAPLMPADVALPDGSATPAWLETPAGDPQPLVDAVLQGFPPGETRPVTALFGGLDAMSGGGLLHLALQTEDGVVHELDLPVPAYPARW